MAERTYSDFDLMIEGSEEGGYHARVIDSPSGEATASFDLPFSELELENFMLKVGRPRRGTRRLESPEMEAARAFGTKLFDAVFHDDLKLTLRRSLDEVERRDEGLRIRLRFSDTPELASLPWEFLFNETDDKFLVLSAWTPIVRYLDLTKSIEPLTVTAPLRILVMISSPHDYPGLDVEEEWSRIEVALRPLVETGSVVIDRIEEATLLELQRALRRSDYHIFHFVGHGGFNEQADDGVLVLEDGSNRSRQVAGRDLGTILDDHRSLRLAVLNACEGARAGSTDPFSGTAQSLVRQGIPAVVAMQFEITDAAAIVFAQEFYAAIADGLPVDAAIGEARRAIFGQGNDIEWATPVVYLRGDGRLFDVLAAPPPQQVADDEEPTAAVFDLSPRAETATAATGEKADAHTTKAAADADPDTSLVDQTPPGSTASPPLRPQGFRPRWLILALVLLGMVMATTAWVLWPGGNDDAASELLACLDPAGGEFTPLEFGDDPTGEIVHEDGTLQFEVTGGGYRELPGGWEVVLATAMTNMTTSDESHGYWHYDDLAVDGRRFDATCFAPKEVVLAPDEISDARVGFQVTRDPRGSLQLVLEGDVIDL